MERTRPRRTMLCWLGALLVFASSAGFLWRVASPQWVRTPDALDYAQMGRELARGHGFATLQIFPRHLPYLAERGWLASGEAVPNLYRYPVQPLLNSLALQWQPDARKAAALVSGLASALACALLWGFGLRLFGISAAALGALAAASDPYALALGVSGLGDPVGVLLVLVCVALAMAKEPLSLGRATALGAAGGLAALARTQLAFVAPICVAFSLWHAPPLRRRGVVLAAGVAFLCVCSPWLGRNALLTGDPLFSFSSTRNLVLESAVPQPDLEMSIAAPVAASAVAERYGGEILAKTARQLFIEPLTPAYWFAAFPNLGLWPLVMAIAGAFLAREPMRTPLLRLLALTGLLLAANVATQALAFPDARFQLPLRPLLLLGGAAGLVALTKRGDLLPLSLLTRRMLLCGIAVLVLFSSLPDRVFEGSPGSAPPNEWSLLSEWVGADELVASNASQLVAFHAERRSLRLPIDPLELTEIDRRFARIDWLVLSSDWVQRSTTGAADKYAAYRSWLGSPEFLALFEAEPAGRLPHGGLVFARSAR